MINSKNVVRREMSGVIRAEMFGQLTSGLENAWNKLKGEGKSKKILFFKFKNELVLCENLKYGSLNC